MTVHALPPTIAGLRYLLANRWLSASEALDAQVAHLQAHAERYRCVTHLFGKPARIVEGGLLSGVGLAHKDIFDTAERRAGCGRLQGRPGLPAAGAATAIRRLESAGAAHLAALTMAEYACGATGETWPALQPVNPLDPELAVGGSSSGSAVAVAAGLCYASLGTDTAGSVRIPAATCGILGLKLTHGLVPADGMYPLAPSLDSLGILARSSPDAALVLASLGHDAHRALRFAAASDDGIAHHLLTQALPRIGSVMAPDVLDSDIAAALQEFIASLGKDKVVPLAVPEMQEMSRCAETLLHVEAAHQHWDRLRHRREELRPGTRAVTEPGAAIPALWYREALARRAAYVERVADQWFGAADIVLAPAMPLPLPDWSEVHTASPSFNPRRLLAMHSWMPFVNYLGFPSIVFPVGVDARNRPVSVQAIARPHGECALLAFAYRIERERYGKHGFAAPAEHVLVQQQADQKATYA